MSFVETPFCQCATCSESRRFLEKQKQKQATLVKIDKSLLKMEPSDFPDQCVVCQTTEQGDDWAQVGKQWLCADCFSGGLILSAKQAYSAKKTGNPVLEISNDDYCLSFRSNVPLASSGYRWLKEKMTALLNEWKTVNQYQQKEKEFPLKEVHPNTNLTTAYLWQVGTFTTCITNSVDAKEKETDYGLKAMSWIDECVGSAFLDPTGKTKTQYVERLKQLASVGALSEPGYNFAKKYAMNNDIEWDVKYTPPANSGTPMPPEGRFKFPRQMPAKAATYWVGEGAPIDSPKATYADFGLEPKEMEFAESFDKNEIRQKLGLPSTMGTLLSKDVSSAVLAEYERQSTEAEPEERTEGDDAFEFFKKTNH